MPTYKIFCFHFELRYVFFRQSRSRIRWKKFWSSQLEYYRFLFTWTTSSSSMSAPWFVWPFSKIWIFILNIDYCVREIFVENHNKVYLWSDPDLVFLFIIPDTGNPFLSKENNIAIFSRVKSGSGLLWWPDPGHPFISEENIMSKLGRIPNLFCWGPDPDFFVTTDQALFL